MGDTEEATKWTSVAKPGVHRLSITLSEEECQTLVEVAGQQLREPNNMLAYALRDRLKELLGVENRESVGS